MSDSNVVWSSDGGSDGHGSAYGGGREPSPSSRPPKPSKSPKSSKRGKARRNDAADSLPSDPRDGVVRLHRGKSARGGKPGTLVVGLPGSEGDLDAVLKRCKQRIGTGGTRQERVLVLQGDHREKLKTLLEAEGHRVKLAGG